MENGPLIDDFPIKTSIYKGFSMAMLNNQMVQYISLDALQFAPPNMYADAGLSQIMSNLKSSY